MSSRLTIALIALVSVLFLYSSTSTAQKPAPAVPEGNPDYSQEALVIEQTKLLYRFEKDGTGVRELNFRARVQTDAAVQRFGQLIFPYSSANEQVDIDFIRVKKSDGTIVTSTASDVQDLSAPIAREAPIYTDLRQKHVTVRGLRAGDVLEYHIIWKLTTALAANHFWLEHDFIEPGVMIVLDEQLEINIPRDSKVKLKTEKDKDAVVKDQDDRRIYTWKFASLKRNEEDKTDASKKPKREDDEPKPPQVQMSTFQSWGEVGQWYAGLERDRVTPDDRIKAKTAELVKGLATEKEKVEALYSYVAKNFRYVSLSLGQGRYQPHAAADVMANEYGDCKDKHTLLSAMLSSAGLRAYPALMNSGRKIDPEVPSPGQFDHVITTVPLASETLWMDTTAEVAPFRLLSPTLRDKKALVVPINAVANLETTPAEPPFLSTEIVEVTGEVNELGKLTGKAHLSMRGDSEMFLRLLFRRTPKSEWNRIGYYLSSLYGSRGDDVTDIKPSDPVALERPFELDYNFSDDTFLDWSSKKEKIRVPLPSFNIASVDSDSQEGSKPIQLGPPIDITYRLKLTIPAKYQTRIPLPLKVSRDYAEYTSSYKLEGNILTVERKYRLNRRELPPERTQDFIAFAAAAGADEGQVISLETDVAGTPAIPETVKTEDLVQAAEAAIKNQNYPLAEELLKRVLDKEPKHKDVRRQLGWTLYIQQKYDDAITALREQTKINPFDNYSYNLMGRVYWSKSNHQEAEVAFRKQLEITPLDPSAKANLAQLLVDWRKYKEAIPELEQAISLNPDSQGLYISLGRAYLHTGDTAKGIEWLDKAVKLEPGPYVWNDVAYNLALGKVQLEKAQQYAESAVTSMATELRNVELNQVSMDDLRNVSALAAYWDTLGWVHYQKGQLGIAEKYIRASWVLSHHSEVGAHLAEIMEKAGKKEDAIKLYALAVNASRPVPEAAEGLSRVAGKPNNEELLRNALTEMNQLRVVNFASGQKFAKAIEGQAFVALAPGADSTAKVVDVKFISGDQKLVPVTAALKTANFNFVFPDSANTKIIRRGTLYCEPTGACKFIMVTPDGVTSVE
jgi:tetratricopeptide (TPR) repeat protein